MNELPFKRQTFCSATDADRTHRIELKAMTTPQFIARLDGKIAEHGDGKLTPPCDVFAQELEGPTRSADARPRHRTNPGTGGA
jgi:hypothetical protein